MDGPNLEDWQEWRRRCARNLCSAPTQRRLGTFAKQRFAMYLQRCRTITNLAPDDLRAQLPEADIAWHLFECHARLTRTRAGKCYKAWIFAHLTKTGGEPLDVVQSSATLILRDAVRKHLTAETAQHRMVSLDAPLPGCEPHLSLHDLLPCPEDGTDALAERESDRLARQHAATVFRLLRHPERLGLLARFLGIPVSDPAVLRATGLSQSRLNHITRRVIERIRESLRQHYRADSAATIRTLTLKVIDHLEQNLFAWRQSTPGLPGFTRQPEGQLHVETAQS